MRKFPPKLFKILPFVIVAAVAAAFLTCGFFTGRAMQPQREYNFSFHAKVLEVHEHHMLVEDILEESSGHRDIYEVAFPLPPRNHKAKILNADGKTIPPEEIPVNSIVLIVYDGYTTLTYPPRISIAYLIQTVGELPNE